MILLNTGGMKSCNFTKFLVITPFLFIWSTTQHNDRTNNAFTSQLSDFCFLTGVIYEFLCVSRCQCFSRRPRRDALPAPPSHKITSN